MCKVEMIFAVVLHTTVETKLLHLRLRPPLNNQTKILSCFPDGASDANIDAVAVKRVHQ